MLVLEDLVVVLVLEKATAYESLTAPHIVECCEFQIPLTVRLALGHCRISESSPIARFLRKESCVLRDRLPIQLSKVWYTVENDPHSVLAMLRVAFQLLPSCYRQPPRKPTEDQS